ncbi:MAG: hypothetical protein HQK53_19080, partial [Oligoflexia bacterium]|nr:hypothetical protein [Oligoflexia bacterium]
EVGNLKSKRDFLDVENVIDAYFKILFFGSPGEIYNVCRGESISIADVLDILIQKSGKKIKTLSMPGHHDGKTDLDDSYGDNRKLRGIAPDWIWRPASIEESLARLIIASEQ